METVKLNGSSIVVKPILVFGYGNPGRGDDALGPELLKLLQQHSTVEMEPVELLTDFQLQIEHALDLEQRQLVVFADASVSCSAPFEFNTIKPERDHSYTTHAMSPAAVLQVYQSIKNEAPPPCFMLSIKAEQFELGEELSVAATENLRHALHFVEGLLNEPSLSRWQELTSNARNIAA